MVEYAVATHKGLVREQNEDSYFASGDNNDLQLFIVADGMGGHNAGEIASSMAVEILKNWIFDQEIITKSKITTGFNLANRKIYQKSKKINNMSGMGTTLTTLCIAKNIAYVNHVGDSRAYQKNDTFTQITKDHSYVQELVDAGIINNKDARDSIYRNLITRAVGTNNRIEVDGYDITLNDGDLFLLCSDGLTEYVEDDVLNEILSDQTKSLQKIVDKLLQLTLDGGAADNVTIILIRYTGVQE